MKTYHAKPGEVEREWVIIDAEDQVLGRVATKAAQILKGKHKPQHTPMRIRRPWLPSSMLIRSQYWYKGCHQDSLSSTAGSRWAKPGETFTEAMTKHPERVIEHAVKGMLPKNTLGRAMGKKLKVYVGAEHPHAAQQPRKIDLEG